MFWKKKVCDPDQPSRKLRCSDSSVAVCFMQFTGCAFGSAAIWQYESLKSKVQSYFDGIKADWLDSIRPQKEGDFRKEVKINVAFVYSS